MVMGGDQVHAREFGSDAACLTFYASRSFVVDLVGFTMEKTLASASQPQTITKRILVKARKATGRQATARKGISHKVITPKAIISPSSDN